MIITWTFLQRTQPRSVSVNENDQYFCTDAIVEKFSIWKYERNNVLNYSRLIQMTKNIFSCLIFFINIKWADNKIHLYMMLTINLLILFCVWIEVRRVKRFQFNTV